MNPNKIYMKKKTIRQRARVLTSGEAARMEGGGGRRGRAARSKGGGRRRARKGAGTYGGAEEAARVRGGGVSGKGRGDGVLVHGKFRQHLPRVGCSALRLRLDGNGEGQSGARVNIPSVL